MLAIRCLDDAGTPRRAYGGSRWSAWKRKVALSSRIRVRDLGPVFKKVRGRAHKQIFDFGSGIGRKYYAILAHLAFAILLVLSNYSCKGEEIPCKALSQLWIPSGNETVAKWASQPPFINYALLFDEHIKHGEKLDKFLDLVMHAWRDYQGPTNLNFQFTVKGSVRLFIFVSDDIANSKFLNGKYLTYVFQRDWPTLRGPDFGQLFAARHDLISRGCSSFFIRRPDVSNIQGAVMLLQVDKDGICVDRAVAELLGLRNISQDVGLDSSYTNDDFLIATKQLYSTHIVDGQSRSDALANVEEICK